MKKKAIIKIEQVEEKIIILRGVRVIYYRIGKQRVRNFAIKNFDRKIKFQIKISPSSFHRKGTLHARYYFKKRHGNRYNDSDY